MFIVDWKFEIFATVMALAAIMAMVGTLLPHAGQPLPQWGLGITVNALLSVYAVVFKTTMLYVLSNCVLQLQWSWFSKPRPLRDLLSYDQASRGPWGAWLWLCSHRGYEPMAATAALLMIISLAVDPFTQQLAATSDCKIPLVGVNATLPRTNSLMNFHDGDGTVAFYSRWSSALGTQSPAEMVQSGLTCDTGNCTFPTFTTLGYCSTCSDISENMTFSHRGAEIDYSSKYNGTNAKMWFTNTVQWPLYGLEPGITGIQRDTTNMEYNISSSNELSGNMSFLQGEVLYHYEPNSRGGMDVSDTDAIIQITMPGNYFSAIGKNVSTGKQITGCNVEDLSSNWRCRGYGAASCSLHKCAREYKAEVKNGLLVETLLDSSEGIHWGGTPAHFHTSTNGSGLLDTKCLSSGQRSQLERAGRWNSTNARFVRYTPEGWDVQTNGSILALPTALTPLDAELVNKGCLFLAFQGIYPQFRTNLMTHFQSDAVRPCGWSRLSNEHRKQYGVYITAYKGSSQLLPMWDTGNISFAQVEERLSYVADSLTAYVRTHGDAGNTSASVTGEVLHYATCLAIRWPWIALPVAMWVFTTALLSFVAVSAESKRQPLWKGSAFLLGWLYRGPQLYDYGPDARAKTMTKQAAEDFVVLDTGIDDQNSRLRRVGTKNPDEFPKTAHAPRILNY